LSLDNDAIIDLLDQYDRDSKAIKEEALKMSWFMRGGVSYEEVMMLGFEEREIINKIIKSNLESTRESGLPFF
jgi:hypothetical protein